MLLLENLKSTFSKLISKFSDNEKLKLNYWQEIEKNYSQKKQKIPQSDPS